MRRFLQVGYYILVEEAQRVGVPLTDAIKIMDEEKPDESQSEEEIAQMNEQSFEEIQRQMMRIGR